MASVCLLYLEVHTCVSVSMIIQRLCKLRDCGMGPKGVAQHQKGLLGRLLYQAADGSVTSRCGVMSVVVQSGTVKAGDVMRCVYPEVKEALRPV